MLNELAGVPGDSPAEPLVRDLLTRAVNRLHLLCAGMLHRGYPRLARGPLNLSTDELLGAVVERMLKALRKCRPSTVRQFFALASLHMRWELNDLARRLDEHTSHLESLDSRGLATPQLPSESDSQQPQSLGMARMLAAIDGLPADEREVFNLVRIQGMGCPEVAGITGVSTRTVRRRLSRSLVLLGEQLSDLGPLVPPPGAALAGSQGQSAEPS